MCVCVLVAAVVVVWDHAASWVSGARFYYLKNEAALLDTALVQYAMHKCVAKGFTPVITPDIVRTGVAEGCGFQPRGESTQVRPSNVWRNVAVLAGHVLPP